MIIAIDGPAGAGKSTVARALADRFGFAYIDTGAMYRALALAATERGLSAPDDGEQIAELARTIPLALEDNGQRILIGERDVSRLIRTPEMGELTSKVSTLAGVRAAIVEQQRRLARAAVRACGGAVLEGRDIQTVVFPDARVKIFLTATPQTRAQRRCEEWQTKGQQATLAEAQRDLEARDERDSTRETAPLRPAPDAVIIDTDNLPASEVVERIAQVVQANLDE